MLEPWSILAVIMAGLVAGFINTLAGSGSLITLPLLIFLGLPANVANGTNRIAILLQNVVGVSGFHRQKVLDAKRGAFLILPICLGALLGAQLAVSLNEKVMRLTIAVIMFLMLGVIIFRPKRFLRGKEHPMTERPNWLEGLLYFGIGIYGGFIQAGVGIFLLASLVLGTGYDLVRANAVKLMLVLAFTPFALFIFIYNNQVNWVIGFVLAIGNMLGAWLGTKAAVRGGAEFIRWVLIAVVSVSASKLLWDVLHST